MGVDRNIPVNVWFEILTPRVSKNEAILSQICDVKGDSFPVVSFADHKVADMGDCSSLVFAAVYIDDWARDW